MSRLTNVSKAKRPDAWVLQDLGEGGAHDLIVITSSAASELHAFGYQPRRASERLGFAAAYVAPRWVLDFVGAVVGQVFGTRPYGPSDAATRELVDRLVDAAEKVVERGLASAEWASALFVVLETGGLGAAASFARDAL